MGLDRLFDSVKDVIKFEKSNLRSMVDRIKKDPERAFIGAIDPFSSEMWGKVTGKDYDPVVNQWGGATEESYAAAEAEGINTAPGRAMHDVAQVIAGSYAGGYGAERGAAALPELPQGWTESIPEGVRDFIPGGGGQVLTPEQAGVAGQVFGGAATAGYLKDEHDFRTDPGFPPLPEGTYVPGDISPNYQSFMDRYGGGRMPETRHQPGKPGTPVGAPQPAFSYQPTPPVGWV